jgi:hypothetical protein
MSKNLPSGGPSIVISYNSLLILEIEVPTPRDSLRDATARLRSHWDWAAIALSTRELEPRAVHSLDLLGLNGGPPKPPR